MGRIHAIRSTPIINVIQGDMPLWEQYGTWLRQAGWDAHAARLPTREHAQRVLGRQDFCWMGNVRHWIWVDEFEVAFGGRVETWRWRLFASKRGLVLEIEDKFERPFGEAIRKAAPQALAHFLKRWNR